VYPTLTNAYKIAKALECSLDWLCGLSEENNKPKIDNVKMLYFIAGLIENENNDTWEATLDTPEPYDGGEPYQASICTLNKGFRYFIADYKKAVEAGKNSVEEYGLSEKVASSMKEATLNTYKKAFEEGENFEGWHERK
jgi:hypothetical protein